jgi:hypothetical protein
VQTYREMAGSFNQARFDSPASNLWNPAMNTLSSLKKPLVFLVEAVCRLRGQAVAR